MVRQGFILLMALCHWGCSSQPEGSWTRLGNGCMHIVDHHRKHGSIVDVSYLDGDGTRYYPKADQTWCDRIAVSGDYVFGELVKYDGDFVRLPATVISNFAFCTADKSVREFSGMKELLEFARTVGIESIAPFATSSSESKPLY